MFKKIFNKSKTPVITDYFLMKEKLINKLQSIGEEDILKNINPQSIYTIIIHTMSVIDINFSKKNITGSDKKQMVMNIILDIIEHSNINSDNKKYIIHILNNTYDPFIENIISVSKGKFSINKGKKFFQFCLNCINKNSIL